MFCIWKLSYSAMQVSVDFAWSPNGVDGRWFDWNGLIAAADWAFVMGYDTQSQVPPHSSMAWLCQVPLTSPACCVMLH